MSMLEFIIASLMATILTVFHYLVIVSLLESAFHIDKEKAKPVAGYILFMVIIASML